MAGRRACKKSFIKIVYKWSRTLHIYVSAALFALLILFCITGITLNHAEWFADDYSENEMTLNLPDVLADKVAASFDAKTDAPIGELQAFIAGKFTDLPTPSSTHIDHELSEITLDYELPAGYANVLIFEDEVVIGYRKGGFFSIANDLHKGRHTGGLWRWVIDLSAGLMLVFAITGLILLVQNKKRRKMGAYATILGIITPVLIYFWFVPSL